MHTFFLVLLCLALCVATCVAVDIDTWTNNALDAFEVEHLSSFLEQETPGEVFLSPQNFLRIPFNPEADAKQKLILDYLMDDEFLHRRRAHLSMMYHLSPEEYDRLFENSRQQLIKLADAQGIRYSIYDTTYDKLLFRIEEVMRTNPDSPSFVDAQATVNALRTYTYLFEGRSSLNNALYQDAVALGISDKIVNALKWLANQISKNKCGMCTGALGQIKTSGCKIAVKSMCTAIVAAASGGTAAVLAHFVCADPINLSTLFAGWCKSLLDKVMESLRISDQCICSLVKLPKWSIKAGSIMGMSFPAMTISKGGSVCNVNAGQCITHSKKDKKNWNGTKGENTSTNNLLTRVVGAVGKAGIDTGVDGLYRSVSRSGLRAGMRGAGTFVKDSLKRDNLKRTGKAIGLFVGQKGSEQLVKEGATKVKDLAGQGVDKLANATGTAAANKYTESMMAKMKKKAASMPASKRSAFIKAETEKIQATAGKIKGGFTNYGAAVAKTVINYQVDTGVKAINKGIENGFKGVGSADNQGKRAKFKNFTGEMKAGLIKSTQLNLKNRTIGTIADVVKRQHIAKTVDKGLAKWNTTASALGIQRKLARAGRDAKFVGGKFADQGKRGVQQGRKLTRDALRRAGAASRRVGDKVRAVGKNTTKKAKAALKEAGKRAGKAAARAKDAARTTARAVGKKAAIVASKAKESVKKTKDAARRATRAVANKTKAIAKKTKDATRKATRAVADKTKAAAKKTKDAAKKTKDAALKAARVVTDKTKAAVKKTKDAARKATRAAAAKTKAAARVVAKTATRAKRAAGNAAKKAASKVRSLASRAAAAVRRVARRATPARRRAAPARRKAARKPAKKASAPLVTVTNDKDLLSKVKSGKVRVGAVYKKGGACYKLQAANGKSAKTSCPKAFYL